MKKYSTYLLSLIFSMDASIGSLWASSSGWEAQSPLSSLNFKPKNLSNYLDTEPGSLLNFLGTEPTIQRHSFDFTPRLPSVSSLLESNNINYDVYPQLEINNPIQTSTFHSLPISQEYIMLPPAIPILLPICGIDNTQNAQQETEPIQDQLVSHVQTPIAQSAPMVESLSCSPDINEAVEIPDDVSTQSETDKIAPIQLMASRSKVSESMEKNKNATNNAFQNGLHGYKNVPKIDPQAMLPEDVKQAQKDFLFIGRAKVTNTGEAPWLIAAITWYFSHQRLICVMNGNSENLSAQQIYKLRNYVKQYKKRVLQAQQLLKPDAFQVLMPIISAQFPDATQDFIIEEFDRRKAQMLRYLECLEPKCEGDLQKLIENGLDRLQGLKNAQDSTVALPDPAPRKRKGHSQKDNLRVTTSKTGTHTSDTTCIHANPPTIVSINSSSPSHEELKRRIESQEKELERRNQELESLREQLRTLGTGNLAPNNQTVSDHTRRAP